MERSGTPFPPDPQVAPKASEAQQGRGSHPLLLAAQPSNQSGGDSQEHCVKGLQSQNGAAQLRVENLKAGCARSQTA